MLRNAVMSLDQNEPQSLHEPPSVKGAASDSEPGFLASTRATGTRLRSTQHAARSTQHAARSKILDQNELQSLHEPPSVKGAASDSEPGFLASTRATGTSSKS